MLSALLAVVVNEALPGDADEPGDEGARWVVLVKVPRGVRGDLLQDVLGLVCIAKGHVDEGTDRAVVLHPKAGEAFKPVW